MGVGLRYFSLETAWSSRGSNFKSSNVPLVGPFWVGVSVEGTSFLSSFRFMVIESAVCGIGVLLWSASVERFRGVLPAFLRVTIFVPLGVPRTEIICESSKP
jgi:hypothetical protein